MLVPRMTKLALAAVLAAAWLSSPVRAGTMSYEVLINTSGLIQGPGTPTSPALIDMALSATTYPGSPSVSAVFYGPVTDGVISPGFDPVYDPAMGTIAGDLTTPGGVTMNNTAYSEGGQDFSINSFFDVFVTLSGSEIGPGAVGPLSGTVVSINIYDSGSGSESATFTVNPNSVVDGTIGAVPSDANVTIIPQVSSVPEPSSVVLLGAGLIAVATVNRRRKRFVA